MPVGEAKHGALEAGLLAAQWELPGDQARMLGEAEL